MDPYELFRVYICVKLHMQGKWDICKSGFAIAHHGRDKFSKRNDRKFFEVLAGRIKKKDSLGLMLSLFSDQDFWIGDAVMGGQVQSAISQYQHWSARMRSFDDYVSTDLLFIENGCREKNVSPLRVFQPSNESPPFVLNLLLKKAIYAETWIIIDYLLEFVKNTDRECPLVRDMDPSWRMTTDRMQKYANVIFKYLIDPQRSAKQITSKHSWLCQP